MYPHLVVGFHGCSKAVGEAVLSGEIRHLSPSNNSDEWLGKGVYFWENDYDHALQWSENHIHPSDEPFVLGALINPGNCFDLTTTAWLQILQKAASGMKLEYRRRHKRLPSNHKLRHSYDCALVNYARETWNDMGTRGEINTVRGAFYEGENIGDSTFGSLNHIQWAVATPEISILGYFRPTEAMRELLRVM